MVTASLILALVVVASPALADFSYGDGCLFDGTIYQKGEMIQIPYCLGQMECLGDNALGDIEPATDCERKRDVADTVGCNFDGHEYGVGEKIIIQNCLAEYTCNGNNELINYKQLFGICPDEQ
ncbi:hypothetical protein ElyMa_004595300 [Elysia marginata]|uniref:SUEL-type lectin domain-containing protein n=1 Tax=Elysia marginata TaxID=1093978 RepID=A0AAV4HWL2_9GAST|nr:hypothetical protein ElyMa_004595300 [Elysia marginata]